MNPLLFALLLVGLVWPACTINVGTGTAQCDGGVMPSGTNMTYIEDLATSETKSVILRFSITIGRNITYEPATFIKVNGVYISSKICDETPALCVEAITAPKITKTPVAPKQLKTASQCAWARAKDWDSWCWQMLNSGDKIDCTNANPTAKNEILDNLAKGFNSNQAMCLRGAI